MNERLKELIEKAGLSALLGNNWLYGEELEEFAELVRQDERDKHAEYTKNLKDICMVSGFLLSKLNITCAMSFGMQEQVHNCIEDCNKAIRARGDHAPT